MERKNAWNQYEEKELAAVEELSARYRRFLSAGKTERECIAQAVKAAEDAGYQELYAWVKEGKEAKPGTRLYAVHMHKSAVLFQVGEKSLEQGMNLIGSHVDSPRLDVKQVPLYEQQEQVYLDTHYYGGVKKYQWMALPLALHGVVVRKDGTTVPVCIGEKEEDPVFVITDLLPHLGHEKEEQKVKEFIDAEKMDLLIGSRPVKNSTVKGRILQILENKYQVGEGDFFSAELEIVPAGGARVCGLDESLILAYGQDDRSCVFASVEAMLGLPEDIQRTACCLLVDKEEIGSAGATGMKSRFLENAAAELLRLTNSGKDGDQELQLRRCLMNSLMLSADVSAAFDPMFADYFEKKNSAYLGNGLVFNKYSGSAGKSGANDANPEFLARLRGMLDEQQIVYQSAELGAVDKGGGGTIAGFMARYGMEVVDCGVPVLSMHAPWEVCSKADIYEAWKGYGAFWKMGGMRE